MDCNGGLYLQVMYELMTQRDSRPEANVANNLKAYSYFFFILIVFFGDDAGR